MSIISKKLSILKSGTYVKLTQVNGQIIEGTISENDGKTSISIQVSAEAILKYENVVGIETESQYKNVLISDVSQSIQTLDTQYETNLLQFSCSLDDVRQAFREMEKEKKVALNKSYDKFQSAVSSHDEEKLSDSIQSIWDILEENNWSYEMNVNKFLAYVSFMAKKYPDAIESFFYSGDTRKAYLSAYKSASVVNDDEKKELYTFSAIFSVLYILNQNQTEFLPEAFECLENSSLNCNDMSGIEYLINHQQSSLILSRIREIIININEKCSANIDNFGDLKICIEKLKKIYPDNTIYSKLTEYAKFQEKSSETPVAEPEKSNNEVKPVSKNNDILGLIVKCNFLREGGNIESSDGKTYPFSFDDISDISLKNQVTKNSSRQSTKPFEPIAVHFSIEKKYGKEVAINIKRKNAEKKQDTKPIRITVVPELPKDEKSLSSDSPTSLFTAKRYEEAVEAYKKLLDKPNWEEAFSGIIQCYMSLWNQNGDLGYSLELTAFVEKYVDKVSKTAKNIEALQQMYMKMQKYQECLATLNTLLEICDETEYNRILHYLLIKEKCYRSLNDYSSAISQLNDWLSIVHKYRIDERYKTRDTTIYIELSELYYELQDFEKAKKYALKSAENERKSSMLAKLNELNTENADEYTDEYEENSDDENDTDEDNTEIQSLQSAIESYHDEDDFQMPDIDIIKHTEKYPLYCMLTYLSAVSGLANTVNLKAVESAFSYAFNNPISVREVNSSQLNSIFDLSKKLIPEINDKLFVSASLRTLFNHSTVPDYELEDLIVYIESTEIKNIFPPVLPLANALYDFHITTGYGIDVFSDYKTNSNTIDRIISEAKDCCEALDKRQVVYESQGQVRRMREYMFVDPNESELRTCLNIVCENDTSRFEYVKDNVAQLFIRNNNDIDVENIDIKKLDNYIDRFWNHARDVIIKEKRHVERRYDKLKGSKRRNVSETAKRIISCLCEWINVTENSSVNQNSYAKSQYEEVKPKIYSLLAELCETCKKFSTVPDRGIESIIFTANELMAKLDGSYDNRKRKYFFIDFLRGEDVLLDDNYIPDLSSTFCGLNDFNILARIEHHAENNSLMTFENRIDEIFSDTVTKNNFRSARLIRDYGRDLQIESIIEHKMFTFLEKCITSGKNRVKMLYDDFRSELELDENRGRISNITGYKTAIVNSIDAWYHITILTCDFGFYARLIDVYRNNIAVDAEVHGEKLARQLEELSSNPNYDFGVFSKEKIASYINDQKYTTAEDMMNCVRRNDTKLLNDFTIEPFGFFNDFLDEYATNYRVVAKSDTNLEDAVLKYVGKKDIEKALRQLTGNASKDIKGGTNLIERWIVMRPVGNTRIEKLLSTLGFANSTAVNDDGNSEDSYIITRKKQIGKINYPHPIPAFSSVSETEGFRVLCLYGRFDCDRLMDKFRDVNTASKHTIVLLDYALNLEERRRLARKIKEEKSFSKSFIVIDRVLLFYLAKHYQANTISRVLMSITMPFAYYQPFVAKSNKTMPPELFTGRKDELRSIESADGANLVYGGRQLGKSALLKMAQNNIDGNANGDRAVFVDVVGCNYTEVARAVSRKLIVNKILSQECECDDWETLAGYIEERLNATENRINYLLLMLDEADKFIESCKKIDYRPISILKNLPSGRFKVVMAGLRDLSKFNREAILYNNSILAHLEAIVVRPFQRPEATELLTNSLAYLGFRFKDDVISLILARTNYFPGLIQLYCQKLIEAMKNEDYAGYNEVNTPSYEVTEKHIEKVLSDPSFTDEITNKLTMTLFVDEDQGSYYHIIALILAYLNYEKPSDKGHAITDIYIVARYYDIEKVLELNEEQINELLHEMWDLNILSANGEYYSFSTKSFRELLGNRDDIEQAMTKYIKAGGQK